MKLYKLTNQEGQTYNKTQWGENVTHTTNGKGDLCGPGWLHAYTDPLLAVLLNPIHADIKNPQLWECEGEAGKSDHGLKVGCKRLTTIRQIPLPEITTEQRIKFAILCALEVYDDKAFAAWATSWVSGKDRSEAAAWAARAAAEAARVAARAAWAARAAEAAEAAAEAAWAAGAAEAAEAAEGTIAGREITTIEGYRETERFRALAEASAAAGAARAAGAADIDLITLAHKAIES